MSEKTSAGYLLEAIAGRSVAKTYKNEVELTRIHYVGFNGLNPTVDEQCDTNQVLAQVKNSWNQIDGITKNYKETIKKGEVFQDVIKQYLPRHGNNPTRDAIIKEVLRRSGKSLDELTEDDVLNNISFIDITQNQLFFSQCAMIFKAYHTRKIKNEFAEFRASKDSTLSIPFLSEADFLKKFGPPPWELINDILKRASLPYEVTNPDLGDFELPYKLRLVDNQKKVDISVNDLSSGEKVLMSLALAIYNTQEGGSKPELLLLDEPDAPLHPQFSKLLIDTLIETIVNKAGVSVLITTHSPSTVAMSPDNSVFEIDRETKIPSMVSNSHAVDVLTEGIKFLRISYEKRKQIFVESKLDVQYYERLYKLLSRKYNFTFQPVFLEPHSGSSNCTDVISIVEKLRISGSDLVYGIIDFDGKNINAENIYVLGNGKRYSIENYLLDPIYVSLALIRYSKKTFSDFGIEGKNSYTDASNLVEKECQTIIEKFLTILGIAHEDLIPVMLENGMTLNYPKSFLLHQGHDYETKLKNFFTELNAISKGQGDSALKIGILQVIEEYPQFIPTDLTDTFIKVIGPTL
ncbi:AAA family ATPase [Leptospira meyeri]|uniref:AAA family ATPase n=1 Tax=Leptospira meyeri TaxID=29508 RepID=UPI000C2AF133|nr:ABC transporter ATP-binding protein [Leptospira meyeri]PJZ79214.1 hypothetical protein CH359_19185 [Leptospira meyeri]PJZ95001.1 hypothetical protein CH358_19430 [Leptospira meyeri]